MVTQLIMYVVIADFVLASKVASVTTTFDGTRQATLGAVASTGARLFTLSSHKQMVRQFPGEAAIEAVWE